MILFALLLLQALGSPSPRRASGWEITFNALQAGFSYKPDQFSRRLDAVNPLNDKSRYPGEFNQFEPSDWMFGISLLQGSGLEIGYRRNLGSNRNSIRIFLGGNYIQGADGNRYFAWDQRTLLDSIPIPGQKPVFIRDSIRTAEFRGAYSSRQGRLRAGFMFERYNRLQRAFFRVGAAANAGILSVNYNTSFHEGASVREYLFYPDRQWSHESTTETLAWKETYEELGMDVVAGVGLRISRPNKNRNTFWLTAEYEIGQMAVRRGNLKNLRSSSHIIRYGLAYRF